jgi:hypothetical protein
MKIRIKRYNANSELIYENETTLIDFEESTHSKMHFKKSHNKNM